MRAICGVMSARSPIMRCDTGSIRRNVSDAMAAPGARQQPLLELDQRRLHAAIAVRGKARDQLLHHGGFEGRVGRQHVAQTRRQQRSSFEIGHRFGVTRIKLHGAGTRHAPVAVSNVFDRARQMETALFSPDF